MVEFSSNNIDKEGGTSKEGREEGKGGGCKSWGHPPSPLAKVPNFLTLTLVEDNIHVIWLPLIIREFFGLFRTTFLF